MKKIIFAIILTVGVQYALSATPQQNAGNSANRPVPQEYYRRFVSVDDSYTRGFYWLDSTTGHLWRYDYSLVKWEDFGTAKGMTPGRKGTYLLRSDRRDGAYVLHTENGKGWWFDGNRWEAIDNDK